MVGVNPEYETHKYYNRIISRDCIRVQHKFRGAEVNGVVVKEKLTNLIEIVHHLAFKGPIILLADSHQLHCSSCSNFNSRDLIKSCFSSKNNDDFAGHYIVLCGYDDEKGTFLYRNPGENDHVCEMSYAGLDKARTAIGTDDDVIFIFQ